MSNFEGNTLIKENSFVPLVLLLHDIKLRSLNVIKIKDEIKPGYRMQRFITLDFLSGKN